MSEVKWTDDQKEAIEIRGKGIVVSAAAGSGKTAVLIERIIRLLTDENPVPADKLMAVTFTISAAAQLRDKLNDAFEKRLKINPNDKRLLEQQNLLQLAKISTIDSFCLELVKENLHEFSFQGGMKILGETDEKLIFSKSFYRALEQFCGENRDDYDRLYNAFDIKGDYENCELFKFVSKLYAFMRSLATPKKWIENVEKFYSPENVPLYIEGRFDKALEELEQVELLIEKLRFLGGYTLNIGEDTYKTSDFFTGIFDNEKTKKAGIISAAEDMTAQIKIACREKNWTLLNSLCMQGMPSKSVRKKSKITAPDDVVLIFESVKKQCSYIKDEIYAGIAHLLSEFSVTEKMLAKNMEQAGEIFRSLIKLCNMIESFTTEQKLERNAVDFNDVLIMAKQLLVKETPNGLERTELCKAIAFGDVYRIIMIDEFQDVNNLQELIFRAISKSENLDIPGENLFVVGDIKQAIYGFRLTNPKLFKEDLNIALDEKNSDSLQAVFLKKNFRSRAEVINFTNFIFKRLMSENCGGVNYVGAERLEQGAKYTERNVPAEVMLINWAEDFDIKCGFNEEQYAIASKISEMLKSGYPVCEGGVDRPCRPSDFCILVQKNNQKQKFSKALEIFGLKARAEDKTGYLESREIVIAIDLLRVIDNPLNDMAMAAVLMSPVFGLTAEDMAKLSVVCRRQRGELGVRRKFYQVLVGADSSKLAGEEKNAEYIDLHDELLQKKCEAAYRLINEFRFDAMCMTVGELIRVIFDKTDLMGITSLYRDSDKKRANLRLLLEYAQDYSNASCEGIGGFLRYIDAVCSNQEAFKNAMTLKEMNSCIEIKTYHSSKGLEYPFVFLSQLDVNFDGKNKQKFYLHQDYGCGFEFKDNGRLREKINPYYNYLEDVCSNENRSEKMRLLYVGCTRAKEKLFIAYSFERRANSKFENAIAKEKILAQVAGMSEKIPERMILEASNFREWFTMALAGMEGNEKFLQWLDGCKVDKYEPDNENASVDFIEYTFKKEDDIAENSRDDFSVDAGLVEHLCKRFDRSEKTHRGNSPAKLTATEIVRERIEKDYGDKNPEFYPNLPRLDEELDKLSNAEKGTFTHKFMELADYRSAEKSVKGELARLTAGGFFTEKEAGGVYINALEKFFKSKFYQRMSLAKEIRREEKFLVLKRDLALPENFGDIIDDDGMIQGIADCIFKENDGWVLVDYKTDNFMNADEMDKYSVQLEIYKAAFELILGEKIKSSYIYSFKLGTGREYKF